MAMGQFIQAIRTERKQGSPIDIQISAAVYDTATADPLCSHWKKQQQKITILDKLSILG